MKNDSICLSLPGHIIQAEWGSNELILSHSLEHYLASSITSVTCRTRSDRLYIDWSTVANNETSSVNPDPVPYIDSNGAGHVDGIETRIEQIFGHTVLLKEPYCGPTVKAGFPRIYLSTNLVPCSTGVKDYSSTSHGSVDRLLHKLTFHNAVTSVEAHPSLPYIVLGFLDNTIQILCTETYIDEKAGNNDNDINVS